MNNDDTPTPAADLPTIRENDSRDPVDTAEPTGQQQDVVLPTRKRGHTKTKKRYEFINAIMANLDILIYAELCVIYYLDCSFFRLLIRALAQIMFLSPKPNFVPPMPKHRPYIGAIFGPNVVCILLHILTPRSEAGEAMRGYLHGGIIVDLIGQKGPTSKIYLVMMDLLVTALQCFMLAVHVERERISAILLPTSSGSQPRAAAVTSQNHDAEERGVLRDAGASNGDIEMQEIAVVTVRSSVPDSSITSETDQEREHLLEDPPPRGGVHENGNSLDTFYSGTSIVADFHVLHTLRTQWDDYENATASALQTVGFSAEFAAVTANRRINAASQRVQRGLESLSA